MLSPRPFSTSSQTPTIPTMDQSASFNTTKLTSVPCTASQCIASHPPDPTDLRSILQGGYHHPALRQMQNNGRNLTKAMFIYPIFVSDDPELEEIIPSLPGQKRWGVNKIEAFLAPLVQKGLRSVILFGVPTKMDKVGERATPLRPGPTRQPSRRSIHPGHTSAPSLVKSLPPTPSLHRRLHLRIHLDRSLRHIVIPFQPDALEHANP